MVVGILWRSLREELSHRLFLGSWRCGRRGHFFPRSIWSVIFSRRILGWVGWILLLRLLCIECWFFFRFLWWSLGRKFRWFFPFCCCLLWISTLFRVWEARLLFLGGLWRFRVLLQGRLIYFCLFCLVLWLWIFCLGVFFTILVFKVFFLYFLRIFP